MYTLELVVLDVDIYFIHHTSPVAHYPGVIDSLHYDLSVFLGWWSTAYLSRGLFTNSITEYVGF